MTIIQHGDKHNRYRFVCEYRGCIWFADRIDIEITQYDGIPDTPCCSCPECLKWTSGEEGKICKGMRTMKANDKKNAMIAAWYLKEYCCTQEECNGCIFFKGYECAINGGPME